mmetsp:Transcript_47640/g.149319  ORF Transcript_47640/g.149319 Transcript_47640/m.149319 type:complete len:839 (-) Transcript_47640:327-2843(-)
METIFNGLIESDHPLQVKLDLFEKLILATKRLTEGDAKVLAQAAAGWSMEGPDSLRKEMGSEIVSRLLLDRGASFAASVLEQGCRNKSLPEVAASLPALLLLFLRFGTWTLSDEQLLDVMALVLQEDRPPLEPLAVLGHVLVASARLDSLIDEALAEGWRPGETKSSRRGEAIVRFTRVLLSALSSHRPAPTSFLLFPPPPLLEEDWPDLPAHLVREVRAQAGAAAGLCLVRALEFLRSLWDHPSAGQSFLAYSMEQTMSYYMSSSENPSASLSIVLSLCPQGLVDKAVGHFSSLACDQSHFSAALRRLLSLPLSPPLARWVGAIFIGSYKRGWGQVVFEAVSSFSSQLVSALKDPAACSSSLDVLAAALLGDGATFDGFHELFDRLARELEETKRMDLEQDASSLSPSSSSPPPQGLGVALVGLDLPRRQRKGVTRVHASVRRTSTDAPSGLYMMVTNTMPSEEQEETRSSRDLNSLPSRHAKTQTIHVNSLNEEVAFGLSVPLLEEGEHFLQVSIFGEINDMSYKCFSFPARPLLVGDYQEEREHRKWEQPPPTPPSSLSPGLQQLLVVVEGMSRVHSREKELRSFLDRHGVTVTDEDVAAVLQRTALVYGREEECESTSGGGTRGVPAACGTLRGIANIGNSCYMSAFLQVLFHALDFRSHLLSSRAARVGQQLGGEADKHAAAVTRNVRQVFQELASSKAAFVNPETLLRTLEGRFTRGEQHDSCEFGRHLLTCVETCFKELREHENFDEQRKAIRREEGREEDANPASLFEGVVASFIQCETCDTSKRHLETFWDLAVPIVGVIEREDSATAPSPPPPPPSPSGSPEESERSR